MSEVKKDRLSYINFGSDSQKKELIECISLIDKEVSSDKFIECILNKKSINEDIHGYILDNIEHDRATFGEINIEGVLKSRLKTIKILSKYNKNIHEMIFNNFINSIRSEYKLNIPEYKDIDLNDTKRILEITNTITEMYKEKIKNNLRKYSIECSLFSPIGRIFVLIRTAVEIYTALGGKTDLIAITDPNLDW